MQPTTLPRLIALCGHPTSGKSTAAEVLIEKHGYELIDDGSPMRKIAMEHFGATYDDVYTQAGKLRKTVINGVEMEWRDVLGRIGNALEAQFGPNVIPEMATRALDPAKRYVTGSVRREQGFYYRSRGALVIEIRNPLAGPSKFEFDYFNADACHIHVNNNALQLGLQEPRRDLLAKLEDAISWFSEIDRAA